MARSIFSKRWPTTNGKLEEWDMNWEAGGEGDNFRFRHIEYSYSVREEQYNSARIGYGFPSWIGAEMVSGTLNKIFKNSPSLKVHYHPRQPAISVLAVGVKPYHLFKIFAFSLGLAVIALSIRDA